MTLSCSTPLTGRAASVTVMRGVPVYGNSDDPEYQRHGYGKMLFQTAVNEWKEKFDCVSTVAWKKGDVIPMKTHRALWRDA
jgi:GNAT superfamily N-acetyltransferase